MRKLTLVISALIILASIFTACESTPEVATSTLEPDTQSEETTRGEEEDPNSETAPAEELAPDTTATEPESATDPETSEADGGNGLAVYFIDVGQGDSILIDLGEVEILIDGGGKSPGVVPFLKDYVDGTLEVVVATHPHADHIGGLIAVLSAFEVEEIWHNGDTSTSQTFSQFMAGVSAEGTEVIVATVGDTIEAGALVLSVLHPADTEGSTNNNSIVLRLTWGEIDFLFTGDAEQEAEGDMLDVGLLGDIEVLKVGHHGSRTASSIDFINLVRPEVAVYMAKEGNGYGHPHQETIDTLTEIGATIYGTDIYGNIVITTDGHTFHIATEK